MHIPAHGPPAPPGQRRHGWFVVAASGALAFTVGGCGAHATSASTPAPRQAASPPKVASPGAPSELAIMQSAEARDERPLASPLRPDLPECPIRNAIGPIVPRHFADWATLQKELTPWEEGLNDQSGACGALCLVIINGAFCLALPRVGQGGVEVYALGLEVLGGGCNGGSPSVTTRRGAWLHVVVTDTTFSQELVSTACEQNGEPIGLCTGCMPGYHRRRDLLIDPRDGTRAFVLDSDRADVTEDGAPVVDFDLLPTRGGVAARGDKCSGPEWPLR